MHIQLLLFYLYILSSLPVRVSETLLGCWEFCKIAKKVVMVSSVQMENKFVEASNSRYALQSMKMHSSKTAAYYAQNVMFFVLVRRHSEISGYEHLQKITFRF